MRRVIFVGNPGVGKSTLLNSLLCDVCFKSGVTMGPGLTRTLQTVEHDGVQYTDTPGLDDIDARVEAAGEITRALRAGGDFLLVFVVTLEAGRVRGSDLATIEAVLQAIAPLVAYSMPKGKPLFSVIINKCDMTVMERVAMHDTALHELRASFSFQNWPVGGLLLFPLISALIGADANQSLLSKPKQLVDFIHKECPTVSLPSCNNASVSVDQFDDRIDQLSDLLHLLKDEIHSLKAEKRNEAIRQLFITAVQGATAGVGGACVERVYQITASAVGGSVVETASSAASDMAVAAVESASSVASDAASEAVASVSSVAESASVLWSSLSRMARFG